MKCLFRKTKAPLALAEDGGLEANPNRKHQEENKTFAFWQDLHYCQGKVLDPFGD